MSKALLHSPPSWLSPVFYCLTTGCLYLNAFVFPHTPVYEGDTTPIYLLEAMKMVKGQFIYRDFFQFTFPGTQVFYLLLFKVFGARAWIPSAVWVLLGIGLAWICVVISKQVLGGASVYLPSLLFLGVAFFSEPDATHHWFSALACMAAMAVLMPQRSPSRWAAAGALCGVAVLFTHSCGMVAIAGFGAFLLWEWRAKKKARLWLLQSATCLFIPFLVITISVATYLAWKVGAKLFINCTVIFLMKFWSKWFWGTPYVYGADLPTDLPAGIEEGALLMWIFIHLLLPLVYLLFFLRYRRRSEADSDQPWDRLMLLSIVGLFLFLGIATSPVWFRLISVSVPALIVYIWMIQGADRISRALKHAAWACGLLALLAQPLALQAGWKGFLDAPTGRAALLNPDHYAKYQWILEHTHPGDYFFQADDCDEYFLLGLQNPARVSFVTDSTYTRPGQVQNVIDMLEKYRVQWVMWSAWLDVPRSPGADGSAERPLRNYLRAHYHPVKGFEDQLEEAWERNSPEFAADGNKPPAQAEKSRMRP